VAELTPDELATMLARLDAVMHQTQELAAEIKVKMDDQQRRDHTASDWSDRRRRPKRRKTRG
jgi:hypothetical protein